MYLELFPLKTSPRATNLRRYPLTDLRALLKRIKAVLPNTETDSSSALRKDRVAVDGGKPATTGYDAGQPSLAMVCIITPSYNQGPFIEEIIRSVFVHAY